MIPFLYPSGNEVISVIRQMGKKKKSHEMKLYHIFTVSFLLCTAAGVFGVFQYRIYNTGTFIMYYVMELLFLLGLILGARFSFEKKNVYRKRTFSLSPPGVLICFALNIIAILCFVFFLYQYSTSIGFDSFGQANMIAFFENGRTYSEKITTALMHMGSESTYLIVHLNRCPNKHLRRLSTICLFLPGIRTAIMGKRFILVIAMILFIYVNRIEVKSRLSAARKALHGFLNRVIIFLVAGGVLALCIWLFASRAKYTSIYELFEFHPGDMVVRPFWAWLRTLTSGRLDPLYELCDYVAESPYVFSYFLLNSPPDKLYYGAFSFPPATQLLSLVFPSIPTYQENLTHIANGKYSGIGYILIADFGLYFAPVVSLLCGMAFGKVEKGRGHNRISNTIYPILAVMCLFAPVYYLNVGRTDYIILFATIWSAVLVTDGRSPAEESFAPDNVSLRASKSAYIMRR